MSRTIQRLVVASPGGNTTAIVFDDLTGVDLRELNTQLIEGWREQYSDMPGIEQCCWLRPAESSRSIGRLEMFGGEFCGNATRSVVTALIDGGSTREGFIESSGVSLPLAFRSVQDSVELTIPLAAPPQKIEEGFLVKFQGISHVVMIDPSGGYDELNNTLKAIIDSNKYGLAEASAVGLTSWNAKTQAAMFAVWVREVATCFEETACGSGTAAIGAVEALRTKSDEVIAVSQPSGQAILARPISTLGADRVQAVSISGEVEILYDGEIKL